MFQCHILVKKCHNVYTVSINCCKSVVYLTVTLNGRFWKLIFFSEQEDRKLKSWNSGCKRYVMFEATSFWWDFHQCQYHRIITTLEVNDRGIKERTYKSPNKFIYWIHPVKYADFPNLQSLKLNYFVERWNFKSPYILFNETFSDWIRFILNTKMFLKILGTRKIVIEWINQNVFLSTEQVYIICG